MLKRLPPRLFKYIICSGVSQIHPFELLYAPLPQHSGDIYFQQIYLIHYHLEEEPDLLF